MPDEEQVADVSRYWCEDCCNRRFGFTRQRGYQLMAASKTVKALSGPKTTTAVDTLNNESVKSVKEERPVPTATTTVPANEREARRAGSGADERRPIYGFSKQQQAKGKYDRTATRHRDDGVCPTCGRPLD